MSDDAANAAMKTRSGFAEVQGGRLYYESAGSGDTIVLIHGNAGDRRHWDGQFSALAVDYRVVQYDVRGFGESSLPMEDRPYSDHEDLATLLDHLGTKAAHVVGFSMGSGIAVDFSLAYPDRTRSLVSVGPWVFGYSSPAAESMFADFDRVSAAMADGGAAAAADAWMSAPFLMATIIDPAAGERLRQIVDDHSFWAFSHRSPQQPLEPSAARRTSEIQAPTLILAGEHDIPACLEVTALLEESVPESRKVIMKETGHLLQIEKPEEFNQHLFEFIDTVGRDGV
ncbi:MAG: alpha/beta fold hydrolase [Planctomycetota bacterium]|jgi:pimeloyl-ACP methyl ester carboxylesterase